jgi:hypothetical protein
MLDLPTSTLKGFRSQRHEASLSQAIIVGMAPTVDVHKMRESARFPTEHAVFKVCRCRRSIIHNFKNSSSKIHSVI